MRYFLAVLAFLAMAMPAVAGPKKAKQVESVRGFDGIAPVNPEVQYYDNPRIMPTSKNRTPVVVYSDATERPTACPVGFDCGPKKRWFQFWR